MRRVLTVLVALSLAMSVFTGIFASVPGAMAAGPAAVNLGSAGNFVILTKAGISTTGTTHVTGDIGVSAAAATSITGFTLSAPPTTFATSPLVTGKVYAADYDPPTPTYLTTAVGDMEIAYTAAAGVVSPAPVVELGAGNIGGLTIAPGVYKWGTGVTIPTNVMLWGGANDVWIFQIAQTLTVSNGVNVYLNGGAQAANVFWQVAGQTTLGTTSVFQGNILCLTAIVLNTGARLIGRALAQTAVTLDASVVVAPAPVIAANGLIVTSPNGGESWIPRSIHNITWTVTGDTSAIHHFSLFYTVDGGNSWERAGAGFAAGADRTFAWTVPDRLSSRAKVIVYAMNAASEMQAYDVSDAFFTIAPQVGTLPFVTVLHPSAESWTAGTAQTISWSVTGALDASFDHYSVYASLEDGRNGSWFNVGYSATTSLSWTLPATIGSAHAKIIVYAMDASSHLVADSFPASFVITPVTGAFGITVTAPAGGITLHVGTTFGVAWTTTGTVPSQVASYKVYYSVDGGLSWEYAGTSPFTWTVPARLSTTCSVMVVATGASSSVLGVGTSATFTIAP